MSINELFHRFAVRIARRVGSSWAFVFAFVLVGLWLVGGFLWGFSDSWLLLINTTCSVTTFLIVFLIQNTQNRDNRAMHLKLDELLKAMRTARTDLVDLEELTDKELDDLQDDFRKLRQEFVERHEQLVEKRLVRTK
ncbi:MAG: low affinity iron permease family protein [Candidatus Saccharimonadales bacterium]